MLLFRVDGNKAIGSGHVMRCLAYAKALRERGEECVFVCSDDGPRRLISPFGFECLSLGGSYNKPDSELTTLLSVIKKYKPSVLIADSYFVSSDFFVALKGLVYTVYIDDLCAFDCPADCIVNYNIYADELPYDRSRRLLLGTQYAPLRDEFRLAEVFTIKPVENILVLTGGSDPLGCGPALVGALRERSELDGAKIHVVSGALNEHEAELRLVASRYPGVTIHSRVEGMAALMRSCDMAISAAGSTLYELSACGVPTICYTFADNQLLGARGFSARGLMEYAGDMRDPNSNAQQKAAELAASLSLSRGDRRRMSASSRKVSDGLGTLRTADCILGCPPRTESD